MEECCSGLGVAVAPSMEASSSSSVSLLDSVAEAREAPLLL